MASRSFADSSGVIWEVFEVHRTSDTTGGVSVGMEKGWLSFASQLGKRRLAPFPSVWHEATDLELERLCAQARVARPPRFNEKSTSAAGRSVAKPKGTLGITMPAPLAGNLPAPASDEAELVRAIVRTFAQQARLEKVPAIEAMVKLKALLYERHGGVDAVPAVRAIATDVSRVRRWFVEAFYFDRSL